MFKEQKGAQRNMNKVPRHSTPSYQGRRKMLWRGLLLPEGLLQRIGCSRKSHPPCVAGTAEPGEMLLQCHDADIPQGYHVHSVLAHKSRGGGQAENPQWLC